MSSESEEPGRELEGVELDQLVEHLQADEEFSAESALDSERSFTLWFQDHPGLRQMIAPENFADIVPSILKALRLIFGLDSKNQE